MASGVPEITFPPTRIPASASYSEKDQRFAVRDLESGVILLAPPVVPAADVRRNAAEITLSADGRYLAVSVSDGFNTLADLETGGLTENGGSADASVVDTQIVTVDAVTGEPRTGTPVRGLSEGQFPMGMGPWLNTTEVTVLGRQWDARPAQGDGKVLGWDTYAIDVTTGRTRKLHTYSFPAWAGGLVLPGF
ncbi:hypothetical protein GT755_06615 [Herbidospora sp. NEAU-GS84]|uniref:Uncharacterized protein n=1 Tax=Herbidospora solisilvae TaxID=2696284 RepID=A0A7C9NLF0_9ACTN|nr:hypothetical protein [Herbidospora solisilvae]NAS21356.1 hypothetical protein [Herbidospora solisilvae]